jgi:hypothetical protein
MHFTGKDDGPSIEEFLKKKNHSGKRIGNLCYPLVSKMMLRYGGIIGPCQDDGTF